MPAQNTDVLQKAIDDAAGRIEHLPPDLRPVAFTEVFRVLYSSQARPAAAIVAVPPLPGSPSHPTAPSDDAAIPSAALVAQRGSRIVKVLYAAHQLVRANEAPTASSINGFLSERLATKIKGTGTFDVLKGSTPRFFERRKDGKSFVYVPTADGMSALRAFGSEV